MASVSRIIAGSVGGRRLTMPPGSATRPTSDRVREAVFAGIISWLGTVDHNPAVTMRQCGFADFYAGSGAMALEAASRGAGPVLMVEKDRRTAGIARRNAAELGLLATVRTGKVEVIAAESNPSPYDIVWLDPPYELGSEAVDQVIRNTVEQGWVSDDGLIVVERSSRSVAPVWPSGFDQGWSKTYGETVVYFGHA